MPQFYYQALDANQQQVTGDVSAESLAQAVTKLELQGLTVQSIKAAPSHGPAEGEESFAANNVTQQAIVEEDTFERHLQRVMGRGREILPALLAYAQELPKGQRRRQLESVLGILERGDATEAASAFASLPKYWIPLLGAATASRDPGRIFREFVQESERAIQLQRQWWLALTYPALVGSLALAVLAAISIFVVPIFREVFTSFQFRLPVLTVLILTTAEWIASGRILIVAAVLFIAWMLLRFAMRWLPLSLRNWCSDHFGMRWGKATALARFSQFTADLLEAELDVSEAVRLAAFSAGSSPLRRAAGRFAGDFLAGRDLARSGSSIRLPSTILFALGTGMPEGSRIRLLREISACYAERSRTRLSWTRGIIEPLAICAIGVVVGTAVLALFLPLLTLIEALS